MDSTQVIRAEEVPHGQPTGVASGKLEEPAAVVIYGATGDLTSRKLLPELFSLWHDGYLPPDFVIVGVGRRDKTDAGFRDELRPSSEEHTRAHPNPAAGWDQFAP